MEAKKPTYYAIDEKAARHANDVNSFSDYLEGRQTSEYRAAVDRAFEIGEAQKRKVDPMYHEKIDGLVEAYARKLAENLNAGNRIDARCPSILVAGGSNFPVRKKEKQNAARDRNMEEWRRIQQILDKIKSVGTGGISSDDPQALAKLEAKVANLEKQQELMKAANAAIRLKDKEKGDKRLAELGYTPEQIEELRSPDFAGRIGYPSYMLQNNNASIRRIRQRVEEIQKRQAEPAPEGWEFDGGEVVMNTAENRLQIIFEGKPDESIRGELKSNGFRWAPSQGAWQRQLNDNAIRAAKRLSFCGQQSR